MNQENTTTKFLFQLKLQESLKGVGPRVSVTTNSKFARRFNGFVEFSSEMNR